MVGRVVYSRLSLARLVTHLCKAPEVWFLYYARIDVSQTKLRMTTSVVSALILLLTSI